MNSNKNYIKKVDHYLLIKEIKKSEESTLYLAIDKRNDKLMSVKAFSNKNLKSNHNKEKFEKMIENLLRLNHENIIRLKNYKATSNNRYLITDYCNGGTLFDFQKYYIDANQSQFNEIIIQKIISQIVSGLEYMHTRNIFYSEINLEKILINFNKYQNNVIEGKIPEKIKYSEITLDDSFTLKIADLDYYKNIEMPKEEEATSGTKINLNPNITNSIYIDNSQRNYNDKIELLSLGCMTYELLTGQAPLSGSNPEEIYNKIKSGQNSFPTKLVASIEIISFINGLLQFNPEKRINWSQIKSHPFLTKNVDNFNFIELNAIDKNEIEKNPEECDNLLWLFFKTKSSELILDKININSKEAEKDETEININLNENIITESIIINNENTVVNGEEKEKKIEEERKRLHEERDNAEKNIKKANLQMFEVIVYQQQEVKINDELNQLQNKLKNDDKLEQNEKQEIMKKISELENELKVIDNFKKENKDKKKEGADLLQIAEKMKSDAEKGLVKLKIEELFSKEKISQLKTEKEILKYFARNEKLCINYIITFGKNDALRDFTNKKMEEIFREDPSISEITKNIYSKLNNINIKEIKSEDEYNEQIFAIFEDAKLPDFINNKFLEKLRENNTNIMNTKYLCTSVIENKFSEETKKIEEFYKSIKDSKIKIFNDINKKEELLHLFVLVNKDVFEKPYYGETFMTFLKTNENIIKRYFGENITYNEISEKINKLNEEEEGGGGNNQKENLLQIILDELNNNTDKLYIIISSFFYILFYKFIDQKQHEEKSNLGNVYINLILKNFIIFLNNSINIDRDLFQVLNELYTYDENNALDKDSKNKDYSFAEINSSLLQINDKIKEKVLEFKKKYQEENLGLFSAFKKLLSDKLNKNKNEENENLKGFDKINLISVKEDVYSNTMTIIVDLHPNKGQNQIDEWKDFINFFNKETMFYFYQWSHISKEGLLEGYLSYESLKSFIKTVKICGKLLAYILFSNKFFNDCQISLVGLGLGCYVIKECIKELYQLNDNNNSFKLKNVILIGAAMHIKHKDKWKKYIEEIVVDRFINCFSKEDEILKNDYHLSEEKSSKIKVGNESLEIKGDKGNNLVTNYDFSDNYFDLSSYKFEIVLEKIFEVYKDI